MDENLTPLEETEEQQYSWINNVNQAVYSETPADTESPETSPAASTEPAQPASEEPAPQPEPEPEPQPEPQEREDGNFVSGAAAQAGSAIVSGAAGTLDWGANLINRLTPGNVPDIPKIPEFGNEIDKGARAIIGEMSGDILTVLATKRGLGALGGRLRSMPKVAAWLGSGNKLPRLLGRMKGSAYVGGLALESAASVATTDVMFDREAAKQPEGGMSLTGTVKEFLMEDLGMPELPFNVFPSYITTGRGDSPEQKLAKNRNEAALFPIGIEALGWAFKLGRAGYNMAQGGQQTRRIARDELAKIADQDGKLNVPDDISDNLDETLNNAANKAERNLNEVGEVNFMKNGRNPDIPAKGVHDLYDDAELGMRSADSDGVAGAMDDLVRTMNDVESWNGRVGNPFSPASIRAAAGGDAEKEALLKGLTQDVTTIGKFDTVLPGGARITDEQRKAVLNRVYNTLTNTKIDKNTVVAVRKLLTSRGLTGQQLAYEAQFNATVKLLDDLFNSDKAAAQAVAQTSLAGQIADSATTAAGNAGNAIGRTYAEDLMDRLELLMYFNRVDEFESGARLQAIGAVQAAARGDEQALKDMAGKYAKMNPEQAKKTIAQDVKKFRKELYAAYQIDPDLGNAVMEMFAQSGGRVEGLMNTIDNLENSFSRFGKGIYDPNPQAKNMILQRLGIVVWNNNILAGLKTAWNVGVGGLGGISETILSGAIGGAWRGLRSGDWTQLNATRAGVKSMIDLRSFHAKAFQDRFKHAVMNPDLVEAAMRPDLQLSPKFNLKSMESYAAYQAKQGNYGAQALLEQFKQMEAIATDPLLRLVPNFMMGSDAVVGSAMQAFVSGQKAYYKSLTKGGSLKTGKQLKNAFRSDLKYYKQGFDKNGIIQDSWVDQVSREINLSEFTQASQHLNGLVNTFPVMRSLILFPRTMGNVAARITDYTPLRFVSNYGRLRTPVDKIDADQALAALKQMGITDVPKEMAVQAYGSLQVKYNGRAAIGSFLISGFAMYGLTGQINGAGPADPAANRKWREAGNEPYTYRGLDGRMHSYKALGPIAQIIGFGADLPQNYAVMDEEKAEMSLGSLALMIANMFDDANTLTAMQPVLDILTLNPKAIARWQASTASALVPMSSFWSEVGRVYNPAIKSYERDMDGYLMNRQRLLGGNIIPDEWDVYAGEKINANLNPLQRLVNGTTPFKTNAEPHERALFVTEWGYDPSGLVPKTIDGVEVDSTVQNRFGYHLANDKQFHRELDAVMRKAEPLRRRLREERANGNDISETREWGRIYVQIGKVHATAKARAEREVKREFPQIEEERYARIKVQQTDRRARTPNPTAVETIRQFAN